MGRLIGVVLSTSHQWMVRAGFFLGLFVVLACATAGFGLHQVQVQLEAAAAAQLKKSATTAEAVQALFVELEDKVTAQACSPAFLSQMRLVAMRPDGINEMIYMPNGIPVCSANFAQFDTQINLGPPEATEFSDRLSALWLHQPLDDLGYPGMVGTLLRHGDFAVIVPAGTNEPQLAWAEQAVALKLSDGRLKRVDVAATPWPFDASGVPHGSPDELLPRLWHVRCQTDGNVCVSQTTSIAIVLNQFGEWIWFGLIVSALAAAWLSGLAHGMLRHYFAFEARFLRNFTADRIICTYQPVLDMATGRINGCEVLVRWRDLDDRVVFPDQFLPIIEKRGMTVALTRFVIDRAHAELTANMPPQRPLQVNFNVCPRDLDAATLLPLFNRFDLDTGRFRIVVEIVETEAFDFEKVSRAIDELRRVGIGCYLDDFGRGFSSLHSLAGLSVDGVKLDRSFSMAADASLLGQMLPEALAMVRHAGRKTIVEGVETEDRLRMLRATGLVDFVQGYLISRPVPIQRFVQVLTEHDVAPRQPATPVHAQGTVVALRR